MARNHLKQDEINHLIRSMAGGATWAEAKTALLVEYPDVDSAGIDANFEIGITLLAEKKTREFTPGPEAELAVLRTLVPPTVTALDRPQFYETGGEELIIYGTGFVVDVEVEIGGVACDIVSRLLDKLVVLTPVLAANPVPVDVVVTNRSGLTTTFAGALTSVVVPP